nr:hypothetical protein [Tanacetum cinerariifolium]
MRAWLCRGFASLTSLIISHEPGLRYNISMVYDGFKVGIHLGFAKVESPVLACAISEILSSLAEDTSTMPSLILPFILDSSKIKLERKSSTNEDIYGIQIGPQTDMMQSLSSRHVKAPSSMQIHHEPLSCGLQLVRVLKTSTFILVGQSGQHKSATDELDVNERILFRDGLIDVKDIEECIVKGRCKKLAIKLPAWSIMQCLLASAKSESTGLVICELRSMVLALYLRKKPLLAIPTQGIVGSMSRMPTFRRKFKNLVKVLYLEALQAGIIATPPEVGGLKRRLSGQGSIEKAGVKHLTVNKEEKLN